MPDLKRNFASVRTVLALSAIFTVGGCAPSDAFDLNVLPKSKHDRPSHYTISLVSAHKLPTNSELRLVDSRAQEFIRIDFVSDRPITQEVDVVFAKGMSSDLRGVLFDCKNMESAYVPMLLGKASEGATSYYIYIDSNLTRRSKTIDGRAVGPPWSKEELAANGFCFVLFSPHRYGDMTMRQVFRSNTIDVREHLFLFQ